MRVWRRQARSLNRELETLCSASFFVYVDDKRVWPGQPARGVVVMDLESPLANGHTCVLRHARVLSLHAVYTPPLHSRVCVCGARWGRVTVELRGEIRAAFTVPQSEALIAGDAWESYVAYAIASVLVYMYPLTCATPSPLHAPAATQGHHVGAAG